MSKKAGKTTAIDLSSVMDMLNDFQAGHFSKLLSQNEDPNLAPLINKINETAKVLQAQAQNQVFHATELVERERLWRHLMKHSPVGIYRTDKDGKCIYVNDKWCELTGLSYDEAAGWGWATALHPEDKDEISRRWKLFVTGESFSMQYRFLKKNGDVIFVTGDANPILNERNEVEGYLGTVLDITELKFKHTALVNSARLASLGEMSAGIAHEINNPLAIIAGAVTVLPKYLNHPENFNLKIEIIKKSCERISRIVKGLKKFSRSDDEVELLSHSLSAIANEALILTESKSKRLNTPVTIESKTDENILCNEIEIEQVLVNFISNAIDAVQSKKDKWVKILVHEESSSLVLSVVDSGLGIPETVRNKLFEPFFTTKTVGEGTGLGLSISKGILDEHNATITIPADSPNTCFEIRFPKARAIKNVA